MISGLSLKYIDLGNPVVTIENNGTLLPNIFVDLEASINSMTVDTMTLLQLQGGRPTPILLELADKSIVKPMGILKDILVTIAYWEYLIDFMVTSPKTSRPTHSVVIG